MTVSDSLTDHKIKIRKYRTLYYNKHLSFGFLSMNQELLSINTFILRIVLRSKTPTFLID